MNKLFLILCLTAGLAFAQNSTQNSSTQSPNSAGNNNTVRGCIAESNGSYTITDSLTGNIYKLTGNTQGLSSKVGHEVDIVGELTAAPGGSSNTGSSTGTNSVPGPNNGPSPTALQVNSVTEVADHCRNRDAAPPAGNKNDKNWATFSLGDSTNHESSSSGLQEQSSLAETASSLPILGLLGVGALVAGLMVRK